MKTVAPAAARPRPAPARYAAGSEDEPEEAPASRTAGRMPEELDARRGSRRRGFRPWTSRKDARRTPGTDTSSRRRVPDGVWIRCDGCQATLFRKQVEQNLLGLPGMQPPLARSRRSERINQLLDTDTFEEWFADLQPVDPLGFNDRRPYPERVKAEQARDRA